MGGSNGRFSNGDDMFVVDEAESEQTGLLVDNLDTNDEWVFHSDQVEYAGECECGVTRESRLIPNSNEATSFNCSCAHSASLSHSDGREDSLYDQKRKNEIGNGILKRLSLYRLQASKKRKAFISGIKKNRRNRLLTLTYRFKSFLYRCFLPGTKKSKKSSMAWMKKLMLLVWKNLLLKKRHYVITAVEIILPTLFAMFLAFARTKAPKSDFDFGVKVTKFDETFPEQILEDGIQGVCRRYLVCVMAYAPKNPVTDEIMEKLKNKFSKYHVVNVEGYEEEKDIEALMATEALRHGGSNNSGIRAAIIFENGLSDPESTLGYKIRMKSQFQPETDRLFPLFQSPGPGLVAQDYLFNGFLGLQMAMDKILIEYVAKQSLQQEISIQPFPYPPYTVVADFSLFYAILLPQFICLGFIFIIPSIVRGVISERETGIKELMKLSGLPNWMHWTAWMISAMITLTISITIVIFLFFYPFNSSTGAVLAYSSISVWFIFLFLYAMSATSFCFFIASFFRSPSLGIMLGIVVWLGSFYGTTVPLSTSYESSSGLFKMLLSLFPNTAMYLGVKAMSSFEAKAIGAGWTNLFEPINSLDVLTVAHSMFMLFFDTIFYIAWTLYLENVLTSTYGTKKPFYYIFQPATWLSKKHAEKVSSQPIGNDETSPNKPGFEHATSSAKVAIDICHLNKRFKSKVAVEDVTMSMYDNGITALLGHNGAGKTTTIQMLTGFYPPTGGTAIISGYDIRNDMDAIRENIGLCPQNNMLFDELTVFEHLTFFAKMRNLSSSEAKIEAKRLLNDLELTEKSKQLSKFLSGGQKRKLSLGIALIGGTKVTILDEPTSGMDPEARRAIWDLLLRIRDERMILLTTHFMEEADVLADRIAIMAAGRIQCYGSPAFLKRYYGAGYTLSFSLTTEEKENKNKIFELVRRYFPKISVKDDARSNPLQYNLILPTEGIDTAIFPSMFQALDDKKEAFNVQNIGLSNTTMDEVFIKAGESVSPDENDDSKRLKKDDDRIKITNQISNNFGGGSTLELLEDERLDGFHLIWQQFYGLLKKKVIYSLNRWKQILCQILLFQSILILCITISNKTFEKPTTQPALTLELNAYASPVTLYSTNDQKLGEAFKRVVGSSARLYEGNDLSDGLLEVGRKNLGAYRGRYIVAADLDSKHITAMFSTIPYHAAPLALNLASNTLLKQYSDARIRVTNHPLDTNVHGPSEMAAYTIIVPTLFAIFVPFGLALLSAGFVLFPTVERNSKAKHVQLMTGVSPTIFWTSAFVVDFVILMICIFGMIISFPIFQKYQLYTSYNGLGVIFLILMIYGFSTIPLSYLVSLFVSTSSGGYAVVSLLHIGSGVILSVLTYFGELAELDVVSSKIRLFGRMFPTYGAAISVARFVNIAVRNSRCNTMSEFLKEVVCTTSQTSDLDYLRQCCDRCNEMDNVTCFQPIPYLTWAFERSDEGNYLKISTQVSPGIGQELFYMTLLPFFYFLILFIVEYGLLHRILQILSRSELSSFNQSYEDDDVHNEAQRVNNLTGQGRTQECAIVVNQLCKNFGSFAAVSNLSFSVSHGECFGLLGVNGAGKTTSFRIITGDVARSHGNAIISAYSLESRRKEFFARIGYCPQFDVIVESLSGVQMLELFCRLRGIPEKSVPRHTTQILNRLGLLESQSVEVAKYSGGMKRRLSAGIALVGNPPIVLLDEPTSGVDPVARRQFWKIIDSMKLSGQAVILTSHSMEECEALCSRLGIMVNGQLQCLGSVSHLKTKFAQGFSLILRLKQTTKEVEIESLKMSVSRIFPSSNLKDEHKNILLYHITETDIPWKLLFENVEGLKRLEECIEDYSVSETTLEEIFLSFAKKQNDSRKANVSIFKRIISAFS